MEILIILALILINAMLALAEFAIVSARKSRLRDLAKQGESKAHAALALAENPGEFLSTVQVGITLVGVLAGAFGGARLSTALAEPLRQIAPIAPYADGIALTVVVFIITLLSLVIGELVPKRLALSHPEAYALALAGPMRSLARLTRPVVRMLSLLTDAVLRLLRAQAATETPPSEDEIRVLLGQATLAGVFEEAEQNMVEGIFRLADRRVGALITPRTEIEWLDLNDPPEENLRAVVDSHRSHFPVAVADLDDIRGLVLARALLAAALRSPDQSYALEEILLPPVFVPESMPALEALDMLRSASAPILLVIDEFGGLSGLVTLSDLVEPVVGELLEIGESGDQEIVRREDGSLLIDGMLPVDELTDLFRLSAVPDSDLGLFQTLGGFVMNWLGRVPTPGDVFEWNGLRFEVMDMDGLRVDKVLVFQTPPKDTKPESKRSEEKK